VTIELNRKPEGVQSEGGESPKATTWAEGRWKGRWVDLHGRADYSWSRMKGFSVDGWKDLSRAVEVRSEEGGGAMG